MGYNHTILEPVLSTPDLQVNVPSMKLNSKNQVEGLRELNIGIKSLPRGPLRGR